MRIDNSHAQSGNAPSPPKRILVYRIGQIGDTIIALPAFWTIRHAFPNADITLLNDSQSNTAAVPAAEVLPSTGLFDAYLTYPSSGDSFDLAPLMNLHRHIRNSRFDTLVYLAPRTRPKHSRIRDMLFFRSAGIRHVIGHHGFEALPQRTDGGTLPPLSHEADHLLNRLRLSGISAKEAPDQLMDLALTEAEMNAADKWLASLTSAHRAECIAVAPGAKWASKIWPEERYTGLLQALIDRHDIHPIIFGGPGDVSTAERIVQACGRGSVAAGKLTVRETAAAIRRCALYVGNDTGVMHLAAAVRVPCVVAFSAQDWPGRWNPYGGQHFVIRKQLPCEGCQRAECPIGTLQCMTDISIEDMAEACVRALNRGSRT